MADFINALQQGMADQNAWQEGDTRRKAGNALATGGYGASSDVLARGGMLPEAAAMRDRGGQEQSAQADAARKEMKDRAEWMLNGVNGLLAAPADHRQEVFDQHLVPVLRAMQIPPEIIAQLAASPKDDATLRAFAASLGAEAAKMQTFNTSQGIVGVQDGKATMLYATPPDPLTEELQRARIEATRAQAGQRDAAAARARRPAAVRGGRSSGSSGASGGSDAPPPGFVVDH